MTPHHSLYVLKRENSNNSTEIDLDFVFEWILCLSIFVCLMNKYFFSKMNICFYFGGEGGLYEGTLAIVGLRAHHCRFKGRIKSHFIHF